MPLTALAAISLLGSIAASPVEDVLPVGAAQMSIWEVLIGVKRQGYYCPAGYGSCGNNRCAPAGSVCCRGGSYCDGNEYCTLGGCCIRGRVCGEEHFKLRC